MGSFEQLKDYRKLTERIRELHAAGFHHFQIADTLNREGFSPPRRRAPLPKAASGTWSADWDLPANCFARTCCDGTNGGFPISRANSESSR